MLFSATGLIFTGIICLFLGGELLVRSTSACAVKLGVTPFTIGVVIVGYATSIPELAVTLSAARNQFSTVSLANIVGSGIFNTAFVLGVTTIFRPIVAAKRIRFFDIPCMILACLVLCGAYLLPPSRAVGLLFLIALTIYSWLTWKYAAKPTAPLTITTLPIRIYAATAWQLLFILISFIFIIGGAHIFLIGAMKIAAILQLSNTTVGLGIIAIGTSLPELITAIIATAKNQENLVLGNIIGSNICNVFGIFGALLLFYPDEAIQAIAISNYIILLIVNSLTAVSLMCRGKLGRLEGALLLFSYCLYLYLL